MLNWFRRTSRPKPFAPLQLDTGRFTSVVLNSLAEASPNVIVMCLVAHENVGPILAASASFAKGDRASGSPSTLDEFITLTASELEATKNELSKRRLAWFLQSCLIKRVSVLAHSDQSIRGDLAKIWCLLIQGGAHIRVVLEHNELWSSEEKAWFNDVQDERSGMAHVLNWMMPKFLRTHPLIEEIAHRHDLNFSVF